MLTNFVEYEMSVIETQTNSPTMSQSPIVNDFAVVAATVNGSGSQTANTVLIRALFNMGIPVNGKNLFPSNISGLPTWYTIRVSKDGYTARRDGTESGHFPRDLLQAANNRKRIFADLDAIARPNPKLLQ